MKRKEIVKQAAKLAKEAARLSKKVDRFLDKACTSKEGKDFIWGLRACESRAYDFRILAGYLKTIK